MKECHCETPLRRRGNLKKQYFSLCFETSDLKGYDIITNFNAISDTG
jgi:hypothetical protein